MQSKNFFKEQTYEIGKKDFEGNCALRGSHNYGHYGGVLTSCSNGSEETGSEEEVKDPPKDNPETPATKTITFSVTGDALTADDTMLIFKYNRSAAGANELVTIEDCGIVVKYNGTEIKTIDKLEFALDEYGASFDDKDTNPIKDAKNMKEYKAKVSIATRVKNGDTVVVEYKEGVGTITGAGKDAEAVRTLVVALIDTNKDAGGENKYYNELAEDVYRPLFSADDEEDNPETPADKDEVKEEQKPVESKPVDTPEDPKPENPPKGEDPDKEDPKEDEPAPEAPKPGEKVAIGLTELNSWWEGGFEVSAKTATSATIKVTGKGEGYKQYDKMCGGELTFGDNNKASLKVKNNGTDPAYVKIDIKNDSAGASAVTAATVNDTEADVQYGGADTTIPAGSEVVFTFTLDVSKKADRFIVGLNNNGSEAPTSGDITISDAYMWTE